MCGLDVFNHAEAVVRMECKHRKGDVSGQCFCGAAHESTKNKKKNHSKKYHLVAFRMDRWNPTFMTWDKYHMSVQMDRRWIYAKLPIAHEDPEPCFAFLRAQLGKPLNEVAIALNALNATWLIPSYPTFHHQRSWFCVELAAATVVFAGLGACLEQLPNSTTPFALFKQMQKLEGVRFTWCI